MSTLELYRQKALKLEPEDNVAVALTDIREGDSVVMEGRIRQIRTHVKAKHKFALCNFQIGDPVQMYGVLVGEATAFIPEGTAINSSNICHRSSGFGYRSVSRAWQSHDLAQWRGRMFQGFHRSDGQVGTRNYWLVVPLVFCENRNIRVLQEAFEKELLVSQPDPYRAQVAKLVRHYRNGSLGESEDAPISDHTSSPYPARVFPNLDGVKFLTHTLGCGGTRGDAATLCGLLAGYIHHPNVAGATVLSLGCQNAEVSLLRSELLKRNPQFDKPLLVFDQQDRQLESVMLREAIQEIFLGLVKASELTRAPAPLSALTIGLKCGGSDGFSGITANPAIGRVSDLVAALGGKSILSEFPELCGVEQSLIDRCVDEASAHRFISLMETYAAKAEAAGSGFDMNPSPGNIKDGLITDAMKSAGAARKGGTSPVTDVLDYPECVVKPGLNLLCTPGNDVEAVTAQVGAGARIVLFTTGLGTPTGNPIAPVVKLATNSDLARRMNDIIDIDTGGIISGDATIIATSDQILEYVIDVASGIQRTKAELKGQEDFIPWKRGVSL